MNNLFDAAFGVAFAHDQSAADALREAAKQRILVLDGAMGTQIQALGLTESAFPRRQVCRPANATSRATTTS